MKMEAVCSSDTLADFPEYMALYPRRQNSSSWYIFLQIFNTKPVYQSSLYSLTIALSLTRFDSNHEFPNVFHTCDRIPWMTKVSLTSQNTEVSMSQVENEAMNLKARAFNSKPAK
jgi:hypothetical protein